MGFLGLLKEQGRAKDEQSRHLGSDSKGRLTFAFRVLSFSDTLSVAMLAALGGEGKGEGSRMFLKREERAENKVVQALIEDRMRSCDSGAKLDQDLPMRSLCSLLAPVDDF